MKTCKLLSSIPLWVACALPLAAQAYTASVLTRASAGVSIIGGGGSMSHNPPERYAETTQAGPLSLSHEAHALTANFPYTASADAYAWASVAPGQIKLYAGGHASGTASPPTYWQSDSTGYAYASGGFVDEMTLTVAGLPAGTMVLLDFSVSFDGVAGVNATGVAGGWGQGGGDYSWGVQVTSGGWGAGMMYSSGTRTYQVDVNGNVTWNTLDFGTQSFQAWVMAGTPLGLRAWGWVQALGRAGFSYCPAGCTAQMAGTSSSLMDAGHTLAWGGVQRMQLADGTDVDLSQVSLWSQTGLDLMQPITDVPEPGAAAMLALGLAVLALWRRRAGR
jgi:hypothetical protein